MHRLLVAVFIVGLGVCWYAFNIMKPDQIQEETRKARFASVAVALRGYQEAHGRLPPLYTTDSLGRPLHSWRTLLLPFLGQQELAKSVDFSTPWNHPANLRVLQRALDSFQSDNNGDPLNTDFVILEGTSLAIDSRSIRINRHTRCALVFEVPNSGIPWYEPRDIQVPAGDRIKVVRGLMQSNGVLRLAVGLIDPDVVTLDAQVTDEEIVRLFDCPSERGKHDSPNDFTKQIRGHSRMPRS
jgi:hypothetical protein